MKVKLTVARASMSQTWQPGDEIDVDREEARRLIDSGQAEPVDRVESPEAKADSRKKPARRDASLGPLTTDH